MPWELVPRGGGVRIAAFLHPAGLDPEAISLDLLCFQGGFMPMFRFGAPPGPPIDSVLVELDHGEHIGSRGLWHYDPYTGRALQDADAVGAATLAREVAAGGTLRVRLWTEPGSATSYLYSFGLTGAAERVPCLRATPKQTWINDYYVDAFGAVLGGDIPATQVAFACRDDGEPMFALGFSDAADPLMDYLDVYIASADRSYYFERRDVGFYEGEADAFERTLAQLRRGDAFGLQLIGGPKPFLVMERANFRGATRHLPCLPR